jgi:hypothetical protein
MKVITPTYLVLCKQSFLSISGVEAQARGLDPNLSHTYLFIDEVYTEADTREVDDPFDSTKGARDNCVTHYKLPEQVYAFNDAWSPHVSGVPGAHGFRSTFSMDGIIQLGNGIVHAHAIMVQKVADNQFIIGVAQPARGVRSSYWNVGNLSYFLISFTKPTWSSRYGWTIGKIAQLYYSSSAFADTSARHPYTGDPSCVSGNAGLAALRAHTPPVSWFPTGQSLRGYAGDILPYEVSVSDLFGEMARARSGRKIPWLRPVDHEELVSRAFYDACCGIRHLNQNSTAVLIEAASFLTGLLQGKLRFPDSPQDAWLWYRYSFGTSVMDYEDYTKWVRQRASHYMERLGKDFRYHLYGYSSLDVNGTNVECRCRIVCKENNSSSMKAILHLLTEAGLDFNLADLWDLVPFSFIVDWLFPVGDVMQVEHDAKYFTEEYWNFDSITLSTKYSVVDPILGDMGTRYDRWVASTPPKIDASYWFSDDPVSGKTTCKRVTDLACIISGIVRSTRK